MAYEFKKLSEVDVVTTPANTANVLIEEDGVVKRVAKTAVGETAEAILGKIAAVDAAEEPADDANVLIEESGSLKRVPASSVGGFKTAIITDNWYDAFLNEATEPPSEEPIYSCANMTYNEAVAILNAGEFLDVCLKVMLIDNGPVLTHGTVVPSHKHYNRIVVYTNDLTLFWTPSGFTTQDPLG